MTGGLRHAMVGRATVGIRGSALAVETDRDGKYQLPYVPGQFRVTVGRAGYDPTEFDLQLTVASTYPVEDKSLLRVPATPPRDFAA